MEKLILIGIKTGYKIDFKIGILVYHYFHVMNKL